MKARPIPAKVGTQPWLIFYDRRTPLKIGNVIRFRASSPGTQWQRGRVMSLTPLLFLDLV